LKIHWTIDCHCGGVPRYVAFSKKSKIDIHLNSSEQYIHHFAGACKQAYWFINAYPDDLIDSRPEIVKDVDIGFCGSMIGDRQEWTSMLEKRYGTRFKKDIFVIGDDMVKATNSYKIAINKSIGDDINYRVFETLGTKTLLITNDVQNLNRVVKDDEHCSIYRSFPELVSKIDYFLTHPAEALVFANAGYELVKEKHTYFKRAQQLLQIIEKGIK